MHELKIPLDEFACALGLGAVDADQAEVDQGAESDEPGCIYRRLSPAAGQG
jgi:hypothetical protein